MSLPTDLRSKMALAIDVDDLANATALARTLSPWFGVAKVGLELFTAVGPDAVRAMQDEGLDVFLDLKLHDIPTTVRKAATAAGGLGVAYLTIHAQGGLDMLRGGADGLRAGAAEAGHPEPCPLAITVLTSDATAPADALTSRLALADDAGCGGIVCAAGDLATLADQSTGLRRVVPGIRAAGADTHDQPRAVTPRRALDAGADLLVVGRAVTLANDPGAAAAELFADLVTA